ncbi:DNA-binding protein RFX6-like protein, partial [Dinothrombium tinctorium]
MNSKCSSRKSQQTEDTLNWLQVNYEFSEGICLPRCLLYQHYQDYCRSKGQTPIGAAAFGKLVRKKFREITTRRLGTRGKSKYHYYGLGIQKSSVYYLDSYESNNFVRYKGLSVKNKRSARSKKCRHTSNAENALQKAKQLLKKFPKIGEIVIPLNVSYKKLDTFLVMYKTHCNQLLDTIFCSQFDDVSSYLNNFWTGIPSHLECLLQKDFIAKVIECCDFVFYEALLTGLSPTSSIDSFDENLEKLEKIAVKLMPWTNHAISHIPKNIFDAKIN